MTTTPKLKIGIIGAGKAGSELHLNAYRSIQDVEVVALIDREAEKAKLVAAEKGIPLVFSSLEEAIKAVHLDVVSICTPPFTHFEIAKTAIANGINVLLEKPILETIEEADALDQILKNSAVKFSAIHQQKYFPGNVKAKEMLESGELGEIHKIDVVWMVNGHNNYMTRDENFWCHKLPGGRWQEMVAHPIYKVMQFAGELELEHVSLRNLKNTFPWMAGDEVELLYKAEKAYVTIRLSVNNEGHDYNYMMLYGSKKMIYTDGYNVIDFRDRIYPKPVPKERLSALVLKGIKNRLGLSPKPVSHETIEKGHLPIIRRFVDYIQGRADVPPVSWREAYLTHKLVLQTGEEIKRLRSLL